MEQDNGMIDFRKKLYETALINGISIISNDKCCQLLAWLYIYGEANEEVVLNDRLRDTILR